MTELLTIELVPETCWGSSLARELPKEQWDVLRRATYAAADNRCQVCGNNRRLGNRSAVDCHEIWQYHDDTHVQRLAGLIALCPACHECVHMGRANAHGNAERAWAHLMRVNHWDAAQADAHWRAVGDQWLERSRHEWTPDLSILREYGLEPPTVLGSRPTTAGRQPTATSSQTHLVDSGDLAEPVLLQVATDCRDDAIRHRLGRGLWQVCRHGNSQVKCAFVKHADVLGLGGVVNGQQLAAARRDNEAIEKLVQAYEPATQVVLMFADTTGVATVE